VRLAAAALVALALAGCASLGTSTTHLAPLAEPTRGGEALGTYLDELRGMSDARLAQEATRQRKLAAGSGASDLERVRAALALTLAPHDDESPILALVEPVAHSEKAAPDVRGMASFLQVLAMERRRLRESAAAAGQKLREERQSREQERQRADALQQKLDALSELEKSLSRRTPTSR
jgi:hypothetical protein